MDLGESRAAARIDRGVMSAAARTALVGKFAVNGDGAKAYVSDVFDIARDGKIVTVVLLKYTGEKQLVIRTISELFREFSVFSGPKGADRFIAGDQVPIVRR